MTRPIWSGTLTFGLVSIPIELHSTTIDTTVRFHLVSDDGSCRLRRKLVCPDSGKEYDFAQTARGIEIAPDQYVIVSPEELEKLQPESGKTIELEHFVDAREIDPIFFERSYYAYPKGGPNKAYALLLEALKETGKVGIGEFIMREKEHIAALRAGTSALTVDLLRFSEEIREPQIDAIKATETKFNAKELTLAKDLIKNLVEPFDPARYRDDYRKAVLTLVEKKSKGRGAVELKPRDKGTANPKVLDLMARLEASLKQRGKSVAKPAARKSKKSARR